MSWNKLVTADAVITRLYETQGLYSLMNRSYDALVQQGATSVRRPKLAQLVVKKNSGTAFTDPDRKKLHADTEMVETALDVYAVPVAEEIAARFESNSALLREYEISMAKALQEQFDADVIAAAQGTSNILTASAAGVLSWDDITRVSEKFNKNKVPKDNRVIVISAELETKFWNIDVIKQQAGYNVVTLASGKFIDIIGMKFYISGLVPKVSGKDNILGIYGQGLAFILSKYGVMESAYDPQNLGRAYDMLAHAKAELEDDKFAVVVKMQ